MLLIPVLLATILPLINVYAIYPAFTNIIVQGIEEDAKRLGHHMLPASLKHTDLNRHSLTQRFFGNIYKLENDFDLMKVKIFSASGEVLYSTESTDIGHLNANPYFKEVVAKGENFTKLVSKDTLSLEGERVHVDVVETYVPFMDGDTFLGAFEMYYNVTKRLKSLDRLVFYSEIAMGTLSASLLLAVIILLRKEAEHQQAERRAEELKEEVERITKHDLKAPIIGLLGGISVLEQYSNLSGGQRELVDEMRTAVTTAMNMINRSLDLYKMESGTYQYDPEKIDLLATTCQVVTDLKTQAASKDITLFVTLAGNIPRDNDTLPIIAERTLCYSLIANLTMNAIEASDAGERVTITLCQDQEVRITIHNSGSVPEEIRDTFFDKYVTAGKDTGTGIGTYSAKLMTETMGGSITMTTSDEDGTKLVVTLPVLESPTE